MADPFVAEVRIFGFNFAPTGWALCDGQILPLSQNTALFSLLGTTYGGDGQSTYALPDLRGRLPIHQGNGFIIAQSGGTEETTLTVQQIPAHAHTFFGSGNLATGNDPSGNVPANTTGATILPYGTDQPPTNLAPQSVSSIGGIQPHTNFQPYLCVNFIISLFGIFPSRS